MNYSIGFNKPVYSLVWRNKHYTINDLKALSLSQLKELQKQIEEDIASSSYVFSLLGHEFAFYSLVLNVVNNKELDELKSTLNISPI